MSKSTYAILRGMAFGNLSIGHVHGAWDDTVNGVADLYDSFNSYGNIPTARKNIRKIIKLLKGMEPEISGMYNLEVEAFNKEMGYDEEESLTKRKRSRSKDKHAI